MATATTNTDVQTFFEALQAAPEFDHVEYVNRLKQAMSKTIAMQRLGDYFKPADVGQTDTLFDGLDCSEYVRDLAVATMALEMSNITDQWGFQSNVNQDAATAVYRASLAKLIPYLYGDHVNRHLNISGVSNLDQLRTNEEFIQGFQDALLMPTLERLALMHDSAVDNKYFTTTLLFVNEYFKYGPGYDMSVDIDPGDDDSHWSIVIAQWIEGLTSSDFQKIKPGATPDPLIPSVSSVYAPGDDPTTDSLTLAQNIKQSMLEETTLWVVQDSINAFKTYSQMLVTEWEIGRQEFNDTIHAAENQTMDEVMVGTITFYGQNLALMIHENQILGIFHGDITNNYYVHQASSSCFRPDTQVLTDMGSVNIKDLREGTRVLTTGGDVPTYGICSDEQVVHPTLLAPSKRVHLWGINDEKPFFTAQHVFHTTTGLRAVDPVGAKLENPWLEVKSLMVGHSLIHTQDGKLYEPVEIKRLHHDFADCDTLHGVHLREGLRSYHANGYLVRLNYPEITIKSLSKLLLQLDHQQRLHILSAARELQPLFDRFGATTLLNALQQQITNPDGTPKMPLSKMSGVRMTGGVEHIVRGWSLAIDNPSLYTSLPAPRLPSLELFQGVLHVDGEYCPHAEVRGRRILWSRQVSSDSWEHGYCHFLPDLCIGIGSLVYRPDTADPKLKEDETVHHFLAKPVPRQTVGDSAVGPTATPSAHVDEAMSNLAAKREPTSPVALHPDSTVSFLPTPTYTEIDRYRVSYDADPWVDGGTAPRRPVPLFDVYTTLQGNSQTLMCRIPILDQLRDALMMKTQEKFNLALPTAPELYSSVMSSDAQGNILFQFSILEPDLISRSADHYDPKHPEKLAYSNLKFTKLGITDTLPLIFSSMRLTISWNAQNLSGIVRNCDPAMVGFDGERHLASGVWHNPNASLKLSKFANGTVGTKAGSPLPVMTSSHLPPGEVAAFLAASSSPVPTNLDAGARELSSLMLPGNTVHEKSQELLLRMMKFHMSDDDLENFMGESRPTEGPGDDQVPLDLGTNLDAAAQQWMRFTYIPAFIGRMISGASTDTKKTWRRNLTAAEESQIQYWWTGRGRGCLSRDSTYNRLNEIAARLAVLSVAPRLQDYLSSPLGGDAWAKALYDSQSEGPALNQIANSLSTTDLGGYNKLQKLCNILQVLQPIPNQVPASGWTADNEPYSQRLVAAVQGIQTDPFKMQFIRISNDPFVVDEYQWLYDAMGSLVQALFSDDPNVRLSGPTAEALRKDAIALAEATGHKDLETGDMKQLAQTQAVLVALRRLAAASAKGIKALSGNTAKAGTAATAAVDESLGDSVVAKAMGSLEAKIAANGLMFVTTVGLFIFASYSAFTDWRYLTAEDHARLILQTMQTALIAVDQLKDFGSAVWLKYRPKKMGEKNLPPEEENAVELDDLDQGVVDSAMQQGVRENPEELNLGDLRSRGGSVQPNDPAVIRIREARANAAREMGDEERKSDSEEKVDEHERAIPEDEPPVPRTNSIEDGGEVLDTVKVSGKVEVELGGLARVKAAFSVTANAVRFLLIQVGTALMVLSCIQLSQSWGNLEVWEKVLNIASIVIQAALVVVDVVALGIEVGLFTAAAVNPFVAPVLIIVGLVIMFVLIFCGSKPQPPLSPTESWIDNSGGGTPGGTTPPTGHVFCATLPTDPGPQLSWTNNTTDSDIPPTSDFTLSIMGTNNLNRDVYLEQIQLNFTSGGFADALFQGDAWTAKPNTQTTPLADTQVEIVTAPDPTVASNFDWGVEQQSITQPDSTNNTLNLVTWTVSLHQQPPPVPVQPAFNPTPLQPPQKMSEADVQHPIVTHQPKSNTEDGLKSNTSTKPKPKQKPAPNPAPPPTPTPAPQPDAKLYTMHFPLGASITINIRGQTGARTKPFILEVDESWVDDKFLPFDGNMQQWTFN